VDWWIPESQGGHGLYPVYRDMLRAIVVHCPGLPDARSLTIDEIRFFYEGIRPLLRVLSKPAKK